MALFAPASASAYGVNECAAQRKGSDLGCTAADVSITGIAIAPGGPTFCVGGTSSFPVDLDVTVNFAVPDRWDVGIFLVNDGKNPKLLPSNGGAASCSVAVLPTTAPFLDLDGAPKGTADTCGDGNGSISGGTGSGVLRMYGVPVSCQAISLSGGKLYIPFVVSWDNKSSPMGNLCTSNADPVPNTTSKCNAPDTTVAAEVVYGTVDIVVLPAITKTNGVDVIAAGDSTTYTVVITNTTGVSLSNAVFRDPAVANLSVNSLTCSAAGGATCPADATIAAMQGAGITLPTLPVDSSLTFTIGATVTGTPTGTLTNTAQVTVSGQTNSASDTDTLLPKVTLVNQTLGGTGSFSYEGTNGIGAFSLDTSLANPQTSSTYKLLAPSTLTTVTQTTPAGWSLASASCTDGVSSFGSLSGGVLTLAASDLTPGRIVTCTFVNAKHATITVTNALDPASDPGTFDLLVGGGTVASAVGHGGTGSRQVPANTAVTVSVTAASGTSLSQYDSSYACSGGLSGTGVNVSLTPAPGAAVDCTFTHRRLRADLAVTNTASNTTPLAGETIVFTVTVTNGGTDSAIAVSVTDLLPAGYTYGSSTPSVGSYDPGTGSWTVGNLASGASATLTLTVTVNDRDGGPSSTDYETTATASSGTWDPVSSNNAASANPAAPAPLLAIVKSADRAIVAPGGIVTYTVQVSNSGTGAATEVILADPLSRYVSIHLDAYGAGVPFQFIDGAPASGLALGTPEYSDDNAATWSYTPSSGGGGAPAGYDGNVTHWRIPLSGTLRAGGSAQITFQIGVK